MKTKHQKLCIQEVAKGEENKKCVLSALLLAILSRKGEDGFISVIKSAPICTFDKEFPVSRGKIDLLLSHEDGSLTIVVIKKFSTIRSVILGIGQLSVYAVQLAGRHKISIRRVLCWDSHTIVEDILIVKACKLAGVIPYPLGSLKEHINISQDAAKKLKLTTVEINHE